MRGYKGLGESSSSIHHVEPVVGFPYRREFGTSGSLAVEVQGEAGHESGVGVDWKAAVPGARAGGLCVQRATHG